MVIIQDTGHMEFKLNHTAFHFVSGMLLIPRTNEFCKDEFEYPRI